LEIYQDRIANGFGSGGNPRAAPSASTPDRQRELKQRYEGKIDARTVTSTQR
jgi:hypothetical protein